MGPADLITVAVFVGALISLASLGIVLNGATSRRRRQRYATLRQRWMVADGAPDATASLLRDGTEKGLGALLLRAMPRSHMIRQRLAKAGIAMSPGRYALVNFALALAIGGAAVLLLHMPLLLGLGAGIAGGLGLPHWVVAQKTERRLKRFVKLFPEAIDLMVRGIRSGLPVSETIASIGHELADPVGTEFRRITEGVRLGQSMDEAMWDVATRLATPEFKFFVISLSVQRETGGNLAETLENLSEVLRRRLQMQLKIKAMSSEAKASAYIIGSLPFIIFAILMVMNPAYVMKLFTDPRGLVVLGIGLTTMLIGVLVMAKMVKFEI
ncbi:MAG TPA: type II secretion system F family protein [Alphaproteobacteria bacterium]|jgi:tight adherence protein B